MYISKININNYRLLKQTSINCEKELSLIIGKNNCGKTSLLSILNKCIGNRVDIGNFEYYDFSISFQTRLYELVKNNKFFEKNEISGIMTDIYIEYSDTDNLTNISKLMLDLDPDNRTIILRFKYTIFEENIKKLRDDFQKYCLLKSSSPNSKNGELLFLNFMKKNHSKYFSFTRSSILYDYKEQKAKEDVFKLLDNKEVDLAKIISFGFIDAKRNVSNDNNTNLSVLSTDYFNRTDGVSKESEAIIELQNNIDAADVNLTNIYESIFEKLINKVSKYGGIRKNETTIKIVSSIESNKLLRDNTTVVYGNNSNQLPEKYNGLGYLNLIGMIIKIEILLSDFRKETKEDENPADINLLFIEEPEAHTHPQMQYVFIKNIKSLLKDGKKLINSSDEINLQTFMTTHSSHIISESEFNDIKYFVKEIEDDTINIISKNLKDLETIYQKEAGRENNYFKFLKQYLTLNRSEIFFADKIILIEGDTERILLPAMMKKMDQEKNYEVPLLSQNISIIEVGNYSEIYSDFIRFIGTKTLIITDIDTILETTKIDKNGIAKKTTNSCCVEEGTNTSNSSLKYYLSNLLNDGKKNNKQILTKLSLNNKTFNSLEFNDEVAGRNKYKWVPDINGNMLIIYQTKENNYCARSFEDSFFNINRSMFTNFDGKDIEDRINNCEKSFQGLKNVEYLFDETKNSYYLAEHCVNKKPSLAMDILLNSQTSEEGKEKKNFTNWEIPLYIREGLEWLQKD